LVQEENSELFGVHSVATINRRPCRHLPSAGLCNCISTTEPFVALYGLVTKICPAGLDFANISSLTFCGLRLKCDVTRAGNRFRLSAKRASLFKSVGGRQFSLLLAADVCASAVVMLDTPCSEVV